MRKQPLFTSLFAKMTWSSMPRSGESWLVGIDIHGDSIAGTSYLLGRLTHLKAMIAAATTEEIFVTKLADVDPNSVSE